MAEAVCRSGGGRCKRSPLFFCCNALFAHAPRVGAGRTVRAGQISTCMAQRYAPITVRNSVGLSSLSRSLPGKNYPALPQRAEKNSPFISAAHTSIAKNRWYKPLCEHTSCLPFLRLALILLAHAPIKWTKGGSTQGRVGISRHLGIQHSWRNVCISIATAWLHRYPTT